MSVEEMKAVKVKKNKYLSKLQTTQNYCTYSNNKVFVLAFLPLLSLSVKIKKAVLCVCDHIYGT